MKSELCTGVEISAKEIWAKPEIISSGGGDGYSAECEEFVAHLHLQWL